MGDQLTLPGVRDKAYVSRETGSVGKVGALIDMTQTSTNFVLPIFVHNGPCFVSLRLGDIVDECECLKYLDGLVR